MMKALFGAAILSASILAACSTMQTAHETATTDWAYAIAPAPPPGAPAAAPAADPARLFNLAGTANRFNVDQIVGRKGPNGSIQTAPADWYPEEHPPMPKIVAEGDQARGIRPCSLCHYPNGKGRSENASPQGLPHDYIVNQLHDLKHGLRVSAEPRKANAKFMADYAKAMTEQEIEQAAAYFASMPWTPWIKVVESDTAPKTRNAGGLMITLEGAEAGTEPLGNRIIETPVNGEHTEVLRDPHSGFTAYVPKGSLKKGEAIVRTGGGKTTACVTCHGQDLNGLGGVVPPLAGRSPSYAVRQLNDIQQGARHGQWTQLMVGVVAPLSAEDMLNVAAYLASLPAPGKAMEPMRAAAR